VGIPAAKLLVVTVERLNTPAKPTARVATVVKRELRDVHTHGAARAQPEPEVPVFNPGLHLPAAGFQQPVAAEKCDTGSRVDVGDVPWAHCGGGRYVCRGGS